MASKERAVATVYAVREDDFALTNEVDTATPTANLFEEIADDGLRITDSGSGRPKPRDLTMQMWEYDGTTSINIFLSKCKTCSVYYSWN